jgi:hypothetical protein
MVIIAGGRTGAPTPVACFITTSNATRAAPTRAAVVFAAWATFTVRSVARRKLVARHYARRLAARVMRALARHARFNNEWRFLQAVFAAPGASWKRAPARLREHYISYRRQLVHVPRDAHDVQYVHAVVQLARCRRRHRRLQHVFAAWLTAVTRIKTWRNVVAKLVGIHKLHMRSVTLSAFRALAYYARETARKRARRPPRWRIGFFANDRRRRQLSAVFVAWMEYSRTRAWKTARLRAHMDAYRQQCVKLVASRARLKALLQQRAASEAVSVSLLCRAFHAWAALGDRRRLLHAFWTWRLRGKYMDRYNLDVAPGFVIETSDVCALVNTLRNFDVRGRWTLAWRTIAKPPRKVSVLARFLPLHKPRCTSSDGEECAEQVGKCVSSASAKVWMRFRNRSVVEWNARWAGEFRGPPHLRDEHFRIGRVCFFSG